MRDTTKQYNVWYITIIDGFIWFQEETTLTESRPPTATQTSGAGDPLSLDVDDLYVKFKVNI